MLKKRLIPCLLLQNGQLVKSIGFKEYQIVGNPKIAFKFFNAWAVDEIIFLDITRNERAGGKDYTKQLRTDENFKFVDSLTDIVKECAKICFVPLSVGGGIITIEQMDELFKSGADKTIINTEAFRRPAFITEAAERFGNQAVVVSIDARTMGNGRYEVVIDGGRQQTGVEVALWAKEAQCLGAGEIFLNSIDRDGSREGYDLELIRSVKASVTIPVIACGGVGKWSDMADGITKGGADAVSAANIFHYTEQSTRHAKKALIEDGIDVRLE